MTGKEALEKLLDALKHWQGRNTIFDKIHSKHILDELELLEKYKRAFEILKDELNIELGKEEHTFKDFKDIYYYMSIKTAWQDTKTTFELSQKEHELLEELMKGENN